MQRILRTILVGVLVFAMSFNPAAAWHCFRGGHGGGYSGGYYGYGRSSAPIHSCSYGPSYCSPQWYGYDRVTYSSDCGGCGSYGDGHCGGYDSCGGSGSCGDCGGGGCDGCGSGAGYESSGTVIESSPHMYHEAAPEAPAESYTETVPDSMPPATVNRPAETAPAPMLPAEPAPMPSDRPAEPLPPTPSSEDSLFGDPPAETPPSTDAAPATEPATPPAETPDETPAENDIFGTEPTPPAEGTEPTPPAEEADDMFGTEAAEDTEITPVDEPAEGAATESADDLFGDPPAGSDATPAEGGATEPAEEAPAGESTPTEDDGSDLFNSTEPTTPRSQTSFGATENVLGEPGGLASSELRTWVDNTGSYSCRGRLVRFLDGKVRLMKENGRTTTVPLYRLSADDLSFVHRQASAQPAETLAQTENVDAAETLTAN